jgi:prenyltransferase beta subunit
VRRLVVTLALCTLLAVDAAPASAPNPVNKARLDSTIRYLQETQNPDGGFGAAAGQESRQGISAWVALALAAAGINPRCQERPGGVDAYRFLVDHFHKGLEEEIPYPSIPTTAFERELMVVNASGTDPNRFAGYDLVDEILARARPDGSFAYVSGGEGAVNVTVFAILALSPVDDPAAESAIQAAADWLEAAQQSDGGWAWKDRNSPAEADMTGAAIQALRAAGRPDTEAERKGLEYLRDMQNPDGGFPEFPGEAESNVASTAWAVQGIWSAGQDPETWVRGGAEPLSYMASLQQPDGHIRWKASQDQNGIWMTAYVAPAFAGQAWPIPSAPCGSKQSVAAPQPGQGEGGQSGSGVIAGGGGKGAPLFSRPKPQSKGRTPGGARLTQNKGKRPLNHSKTRHGGNAKQPNVTVTAEVRHSYDGAVGSAGSGIGASSEGDAAASSGAAEHRTGAGENGSAAAATLSARNRPGGEGDVREVTGTLVGAGLGDLRAGAFAFGAPGLHSAGADAGTPWLAIGIAALALLVGLLGARLERRPGGAFA